MKRGCLLFLPEKQSADTADCQRAPQESSGFSIADKKLSFRSHALKSREPWQQYPQSSVCIEGLEICFSAPAMQKGAPASLVRSPATLPACSNQTRSFADPSFIASDLQPHKRPTQKQKVALDELLIFDEQKILAFLTVLRSIEPGFRYRAEGGCLSDKHLYALCTLKDCDDRDILTWLSLNSSAGQ